MQPGRRIDDRAVFSDRECRTPLIAAFMPVAPAMMQAECRDVLAQRPDGHAAGPAPVNDRHIMLRTDQRQSLFLHVHKAAARDQPQRFTAYKHQAAWRSVTMRDHADGATCFLT